MNAFEPLLWTALALSLARLAAGEDRSHWLAAGALVGLGLLNKYSMVRRGQLYKNAPFDLSGFPPFFLVALLTEPGPLGAPVWLAGLAWLLDARAARPFRFLGLGAAFLLLFLVATRGTPTTRRRRGRCSSPPAEPHGRACCARAGPASPRLPWSPPGAFSSPPWPCPYSRWRRSSAGRRR